MAKQTEEYDSVAFFEMNRVRKIGGDYQFNGIVVSSFQKLSGAWRYVVEDDRGILHIFSAKNLERYDSRPKRKIRAANQRAGKGVR